MLRLFLKKLASVFVLIAFGTLGFVVAFYVRFASNWLMVRGMAVAVFGILLGVLAGICVLKCACWKAHRERK